MFVSSFAKFGSQNSAFGKVPVGNRGFATKPTVRVAVTGASGQIGYSLLFRIANGDLLGKDQPIQLQLLELTPAMKTLSGVAMELTDCAFPLLKGIVQSDDPKKGFEGADYALLVGAKPRSKGMERGDLLKENAKIFEVQGKALSETANKNAKVLVVGNPANTNAMITAHYATNLKPQNITAMMRLDHNRGLAMLAEKANASVADIEKFVVWVNHSATQFPDVTYATIKGKPIKDLINDARWLNEKFIPDVQQRGAFIINARGASSAASAAGAAIDHVFDWVKGTNGKWVSMGIPSDGSYGTTKGLWYGFPVTCQNGEYKIVQGLPIDEVSRRRMDATDQELVKEREAIFGK